MGPPFIGEPWPPLRDAPENEGFNELRDRADVLEAQGGRIESMSVMPLAVEAVTMAGQAVLIVDALPFFVVLLQGSPANATDSPRLASSMSRSLGNRSDSELTGGSSAGSKALLGRVLPD